MYIYTCIYIYVYIYMYIYMCVCMYIYSIQGSMSINYLGCELWHIIEHHPWGYNLEQIRLKVMFKIPLKQDIYQPLRKTMKKTCFFMLLSGDIWWHVMTFGLYHANLFTHLERILWIDTGPLAAFCHIFWWSNPAIASRWTPTILVTFLTFLPLFQINSFVDWLNPMF